MFFIWGIGNRTKNLSQSELVICDSCGQYGRFNIFMTFTTFTIFFIPTFKWHKRYYAQMSCCGTLYALDPEVGKAFAKKQPVEILPKHLTIIQQGNVRLNAYKRCNQCGAEIAADSKFCPKCGAQL
jgi:hypothetical protein